MNVSRALPIFSVVFVVIYAIGIYLNNTFLFFYPKIGEWHWGRLPKSTPGIGIASQWYGWTGTALVGALIVAAIYLAVARDPRSRMPSALAWIVPILMILVAVYVIYRNYWLA